ncbi:hypothetical protein B0H15DRAFT_812998 [Mycena belliarum]|uniref:Uncharacterized protein n=1 Tax=Mycena belliarum TaxID=1033014 RepID=A0AAD6UL28_9AGAR|nr:hypothetical protein B0H15DRAFT_812998 [Mycena belliae]
MPGAYATSIATGVQHRRPSASGPGSGADTPPMSALSLNLQNFAPPPRNASAASSHARHAPVAGPSTLSSPIAAPMAEAPSSTTGLVAEPSSIASPSVPTPSTPASVPPPTPPEQMQMQADGPPLKGEPQEEHPPHTPQPPPQPQVSNSPPKVQDARTPPEAHEAITPPPNGPAATPAVVLASDTLKRTSPDADGEDPRKRVRGDLEVKMEVDERLGEQEAAEDEDEDEDGNEDVYIEIGPDGLRTVADCVSAVFSDFEDGLGCQFCMARYQKDLGEGVSSERPQSFTGASMEVLAAHCEAVAYAWNLLRENV